ncbi:MAG TPA: helix-turn-helix domain-containing protein, partial [Anaerolineaceae bacterium]|nr:helix-turn-helix domain-containing protein [Anaerolineaceae bacterium]
MTHSLGEQLRTLREERNLTLQQVAAGTHIRLQYIKALEDDERELLPSAVQGKGFVRVIAGFLNVPVGPLLDAWEGKPPEEAPVPAVDPDLTEAPVPEAGALAEESVKEPVTEEPQLVEDELPATDEPEDPLTVLETEAEIESDETEMYTEPAPTGEPAPSEAGDIFVQIGAELRRQRETISLTLDDVERFTKVRVHYLLALEEGRLADLPSPVQGRGMLANYANFLNLDTDALLLRFA